MPQKSLKGPYLQWVKQRLYCMLTSGSGLTCSRAICLHPVLRLTSDLVLCLAITQLSSHRRVFKFLIYSGLASGRAVCSHPILRITNGHAIRLAITIIKSLKIFQVPNLRWVN